MLGQTHFAKRISSYSDFVYGLSAELGKVAFGQLSPWWMLWILSAEKKDYIKFEMKIWKHFYVEIFNYFQKFKLSENKLECWASFFKPGGKGEWQEDGRFGVRIRAQTRKDEGS